MCNLVLAADLGGTNIRMAAVSSDGRILSRAKEATAKDVTPEQITSLTKRLAERCLADIGDRFILAGFGYGVPAPVGVDFDGVLTKLPNLPTLTGMNIKNALASVFDAPITVENDATAAAIGEDWLGATRDVPNSICVTLGTGIGGGIILNNKPLRGPDGTGGEIGHICVEPDGHPCGCGSNGCVEQYASANAIERMAREAGLPVNDAKEIYEAYSRGDETAARVFEMMGKYLGIMLAGLINTLNPDRIVICGGVTDAWDAFIPQVNKEIAYRAYEAPARRADVVKGELGDNAGILGVARSAFKAV